jgi:hypothetical protein
MSRLTLDDWQQVHHVAQLAFLGMAARGVAASEHEAQGEIQRVVITITNPGDSLPPVDLEFYGPSNIPLGGCSI